MKSAFRVQAVVNAIEKIHCRAAIMQHRKFRRIEKAPRTFEVEGRKISGFFVPISDSCIFMRCSELAVGRIDAAGWLVLIQT